MNTGEGNHFTKFEPKLAQSHEAQDFIIIFIIIHIRGEGGLDNFTLVNGAILSIRLRNTKLVHGTEKK